MIDTLARHMAALSEARRLAGMVLANNGTFGLWQRALAAGDAALAAQFETELGADKVFQAYQQLGAALAEIEPRATGPGEVDAGAPVGLGGKISLLRVVGPSEAVPCAGCGDGTNDPRACCEDPAGEGLVVELDQSAMIAEASLAARLNRVLEMTAMADTEAVVPAWAAQHDEARVAIVFKDVPPVAVAAGEAKRPGLVSLFR